MTYEIVTKFYGTKYESVCYVHGKQITAIRKYNHLCKVHSKTADIISLREVHEDGTRQEIRATLWVR